MSDRAVIAAALIVGGAIVASSFVSQRFSLSAANHNVAWRMDTWSGDVDLCAATYLPSGPLVCCGAVVVVPAQEGAPQAPPAQNTLPPSSPLESPSKQLL